jgi:hypothetical protein
MEFLQTTMQLQVCWKSYCYFRLRVFSEPVAALRPRILRNQQKGFKKHPLTRHRNPRGCVSLGRRDVKASIETYINIEHTLFEISDDAFTVKVAEKPEEVKSQLEAGFEYVCQKDNLIFLRKRK